MAALLLESAQDGATLELRPHDSTFFIAELKAPEMQALILVSSYMSEGVAALLQELSANWKGWHGERDWSSLEGELKLRATSDNLGHINVAVSLRNGAPGTWEIEAQLVLEAGQLEQLAQQARAFEKEAISAA